MRCPRAAVEGGGRSVCRALIGDTDYGCCRCVEFEASIAAAGTGGAVGVDGGVPGFAGHSCGSIPDFSIENDSVADSGAEGQHAERIDVHGAAETEGIFGEGGGVGVTLDDDGLVEARLDSGAKIEVVPSGEIGRQVEDSGGEFERPGGSDGDSSELMCGGVAQFKGANGLAHVIDDGFASGGEAGGEVNGFEQSFVARVGCDAKVGSAEVNADREQVLRHDCLAHYTAMES